MKTNLYRITIVDSNWQSPSIFTNFKDAYNLALSILYRHDGKIVLINKFKFDKYLNKFELYTNIRVNLPF